MRKLSQLITGGVLSLALVASLSPQSFAVRTGDTEPLSENLKTNMREKVSERRAELDLKLQTLKEERTARLDEKRQQACEKVAAKINTIRLKRSEQASKHLAVFDKIAERVQTFVKEKNYTVEDYDALVTTITEKQAAVQAAIDANRDTEFDCSTASTDKPLEVPKTTFQAVRTSLQEYRTAIKDLIVNVKAEAEAEKADTATPEAESTTKETMR